MNAPPSLDQFLTEKKISSTKFARDLRPRHASESAAEYELVILNLSKNVAKWRRKKSRPGWEWLSAIEEISGGVVTYKSFIAVSDRTPA